MWTFINNRHLRGGGSAVLYRNQRPSPDGANRFCVTVFSKSEQGMDHFFALRSLAVAWRETLK